MPSTNVHRSRALACGARCEHRLDEQVCSQRGATKRFRQTRAAHRSATVDDYESPRITDDEVDYLIALANAYLERPISRADVAAYMLDQAALTELMPGITTQGKRSPSRCNR